MAELKLVVPFTELHPVTKQVIDSYDLGAEFVRVEGDYGYCRLLRKLWGEQETVVIVEHDIVPWPGAIEELRWCFGQWCSCSYLYGGQNSFGLYHGLGCTKLSAILMMALPKLWDDDVHWSKLDQKLLFAARELHIEPHPHRPPVIHLNGHQVRLARAS